jgi:hypothetical protein
LLGPLPLVFASDHRKQKIEDHRWRRLSLRRQAPKKKPKAGVYADESSKATMLDNKKRNTHQSTTSRLAQPEATA